MTARGALLALLVVTVLPRQGAAASPAERALSEGRSLAEAQMAAGDLAAALATYEATYRKVPTPRLLWPTARLALRLGLHQKGLAALDRYLEQMPPAQLPPGRLEEAARLRAELVAAPWPAAPPAPAPVDPPPAAAQRLTAAPLALRAAPVAPRRWPLAVGLAGGAVLVVGAVVLGVVLGARGGEPFLPPERIP